MKLIAAFTFFGLALYGAVQLGKYLGRKTTPPDWEPSNNKEDQSNSMFL